MADVRTAVEFAIRLGDPTLAGIVSEIPGDVGGKTRFEIASTFHPELRATTFYTTMANADALQIAINIVSEQYAAPMQLEAWDSQTLANIALGFAVNAGVVTAIKALQQAINALLAIQSLLLPVDGVMGPHTLSEMDRCMVLSLISGFRLQMIYHYAEHANENVMRGLMLRALK